MGLWELVCVAGCVGNTTINAFFRGFLLSRATFERLWLPAEIECQSPRKSSRSLINPLDQRDWRQKNKFTLQFRDLDDCGGSCGSYLTTFAFHFGTQKPAIVASRNSERSLYKSLCVSVFSETALQAVRERKENLNNFPRVSRNRFLDCLSCRDSLRWRQNRARAFWWNFFLSSQLHWTVMQIFWCRSLIHFYCFSIFFAFLAGFEIIHSFGETNFHWTSAVGRQNMIIFR